METLRVTHILMAVYRDGKVNVCPEAVALNGADKNVRTIEEDMPKGRGEDRGHLVRVISVGPTTPSPEYERKITVERRGQAVLTEKEGMGEQSADDRFFQACRRPIVLSPRGCGRNHGGREAPGVREDHMMVRRVRPETL